MENMSWLNCFLIMTFQKLGPIIAVNNMMETIFMFPIIGLNLMVGTWGALNQNSLRKLMAYSSISHTGWLLTALTESYNCWILYFMGYSILSLTLILIFFLAGTYFIKQLISNSLSSSYSAWLTLCFLSMSGLPPFIGFFPSWVVLEYVLTLKYNLIAIILIATSLISLFFYLRISFTLMFTYTSSMKMNMWKMQTTNHLIMFTAMQTMLLITFPIII